MDSAELLAQCRAGDRVAVGSDIGRVAILDSNTGAVVEILSGGHIASVWEIAAVPGSEILYTSGDSDGATLGWTVGPGPVAEVQRFDGRAEQLRVRERRSALIRRDEAPVLLELQEFLHEPAGGGPR